MYRSAMLYFLRVFFRLPCKRNVTNEIKFAEWNVHIAIYLRRHIKLFKKRNSGLYKTSRWYLTFYIYFFRLPYFIFFSCAWLCKFCFDRNRMCVHASVYMLEGKWRRILYWEYSNVFYMLVFFPYKYKRPQHINRIEYKRVYMCIS